MFTSLSGERGTIALVERMAATKLLMDPNPQNLVSGSWESVLIDDFFASSGDSKIMIFIGDYETIHSQNPDQLVMSRHIRWDAFRIVP